MGMDKLIESINNNDSSSTYNGKRLKFEQRYSRITTYLENDVFREVAALREQGKVTSVTAMMNEAVRLYLKTKYQIG